MDLPDQSYWKLFKLALEYNLQMLKESQELLKEIVGTDYFWRRKVCRDFPFRKKPANLTYQVWYTQLIKNK